MALNLYTISFPPYTFVNNNNFAFNSLYLILQKYELLAFFVVKDQVFTKLCFKQIVIIIICHTHIYLDALLIYNNYQTFTLGVINELSNNII